MPDPQIFKATYSGVPVFEMICKSVAVMRRRSDSWLNATQILKVAGFDKPQRTRVLEREVQKGEHEKVQGGYGKYQGTWVPLDRGLALARQYNVEHLLRPIIDFQPAAKSPPPAPKHVAAPAAKPRRKDATADPSAASMMATRSSGRRGSILEGSPGRSGTPLTASGDGSMTPSPSQASSSSRTPSPIRDSPEPARYNVEGASTNQTIPVARKHKSRRDHGGDANVDDIADANLRTYGDQILEYFISDTNQVPSLLISPPADFDPNMAIDDDGHTPLHWACAMGRVRIVKLLLTSGADIFKVNKAGQTALMRSVMFANNYDVRKFPELYELLHRSTLNIDNYNRTVFHHIVDLAMSKGKTHAARYYIETLLHRLADYPKELADVVNWQDEDGETALTMAARCRSKRLVKILIDHGADPKIRNKDGKTTEDYILEDERFRSSPVLPSRAHNLTYRVAQAAYSSSSSIGVSDKIPLHHSLAAQRASTRCVNDMATMLESLASSFDAELHDKERDLNQAHALLQNIQAEILEGKRSVAGLQLQTAGLDEAKSKLKKLEQELLAKMGQRCRFGWEKWVKDEEERDASARACGVLGTDTNGEGPLHSASSPKRKENDDFSDIVALHHSIPKEETVLRTSCAELREEVSRYRKRRKLAFDDYVATQAESGTGVKMADYRRLISAGCGGISADELDTALPMLLETLESEEGITATWNGQHSQSTVENRSGV